MKSLMTLALIATASTAAAEYQPYNYAYEATMETLGSTGDVLALEIANCPARSGSKAQLFAVIQSDGAAREDALSQIFDESPQSVACVVEVLVRYDLLTEADFAQ